jgi:rubrerythrin
VVAWVVTNALRARVIRRLERLDWLACPRCGYRLTREAATTICPECGGSYDPELLPKIWMKYP